MAAMKPTKPEPFEGRRDALVVNTWLYQINVYFDLIQVANPNLQLNDQTKISFASTLMKGNAANWWYMKIQFSDIPQSWQEFKEAVRGEFIPLDHVRRSRDKLRKLVQRTSVSAYLNEFRNLVITIPNINEDEKLDKFCAGLKPMIRLEVLKSGPENVDQAARVALNVDSAIFGVGQSSSGFASGGNDSGPQPMDIGNVEGQTHYRGKAFREDKKERDQRKKDIANNACFKCHKRGCRPWKHEIQSSNAVANENTSSTEMSEN